ncbi:MAG: YajQ family cyclic di-GMP-binding protein [Acidobacteriota bacterium]
MAAQNSFDVVSEIDMQEVDNAINQAKKEIFQRYDFKGTKTEIDFNRKENTINVLSDDEFRLKSVIDILQNKFVKRGIHLKSMKFGEVEQAGGGMARMKITLNVGIDKENARLIVKMIKDTKLKVQAQIMDDQVRVTGKDRDDLQQVIAMLKAAELDFAVQFTNYRTA